MGRKRRPRKPLVDDPYAANSCAQESGSGNSDASGKQSRQPGAKTAREIIMVDVTQQDIREKKAPTAAYVRLSVENGGHKDEGTLQTQIDLVHDYIRHQQDLELYDTYIDNGVSGTGTFADRPGFAQMMEAVRRGKVKCIVVKDLSRFGRDYLEAATYIDHIFPLLGVRLIAVTDNFDSARPEDVNGLALPVKNLINTMYAKDIGKKIRSSYDTRMKEEKWFGIRAPYGYVKEGGPGSWVMVPDLETAGYVRMMYHWYLTGVSLTDIARRLNFTGVMTPSWYRAQNGDPDWRGHKVAEKWTSTGVREVMMNQSYAGDAVNRKSSAGSIRPGQLSPRDEWQVIPDAHEALVTHEDYEKAWEKFKDASDMSQQRFEKVSKNRKEDPPAFSGRLICGTCGSNFQVTHRKYRDGKRAKYYRCSNKNCMNSRGMVHEDVFKILIMDQLRILIRSACDYRKFAQELMSDNPAKGKAGSLRVKLTNSRVRLKRNEERMLKAYEDYAEGAIGREEYLRLKETLAAEKKKAEVDIAYLEAEEQELKETAGRYLKTTENFEEYLDAEGYPAQIVDRLVEKIEYFPDGGLSLTLKCADVYEDMRMFLDAEKSDTDDGDASVDDGDAPPGPVQETADPLQETADPVD